MPRNSRGSHEAMMMTTLRTAKMTSNLSIQSGRTASAVPDLRLPSGQEYALKIYRERFPSDALTLGAA